MEPFEPNQREWDKQRLKIEQERSARTASPAHEKYQPDGNLNPAWLAAHPPQTEVVLNPPRRTAGGDVPEVSNESEADRIKRLGPQLRIEALEREVAELKAMMQRYFGGSYDADKPHGRI
jgi:hypothetical protein